ncbi:CHAT domain-containing protein [Mucilaginibacter sp. BJC16-A38]|uniref:CHAT domain-containing protein n=1 Tax=Mucilaginibacter phenanthrenivorans TaxID=1234842 RepID=UPI0021575F4E|nr:CHAT domain-containing protein [Mucilaginibacter phenanthrenivorans]MCR8557790.1 CHAT domain-containing protein [Mucilaginibacter phenanthrenivorans]
MCYARFFFSLLLGLQLLILPASAAEKQLPQYKKLYQEAEKLSNLPSPTDNTDKRALEAYNKVISLLTVNNTDAPFLLKTYIATGAFLQALNRSNEAIPYFKKAFRLKENTPGIPDSALFKPLVYCGNSFYQQDHLDSAENLYNKALIIAEKYPQVSEVERLYNTLGVIAYSTGNYNKSVTYYQKALNTLLANKRVDNALLVAYKSNLASAYRKLKRYDESLKLYKETLPYNFETDKLYHNIGAVYLAMGLNADAISWLKKVKYQDQKKLNDLGKASLAQKDYSNALGYLRQAIGLNARLNQSHQNSDHGITLKYMGDVYVRQSQPAKAMGYYQLALTNLLPGFKPVDMYTNPSNFNTAFNGIEILETLLAKANAFEQLYNKNNNIKDLEAALQAYLAFYRLADHIQRFYETDESRMLITDRKYASRQQPIAICLRLYSLTKNRQYITQAFVLDEENKANTLSLYLEESQHKAISGVPNKLLMQEKSLKESITRTALQASTQTDSIKLTSARRNLNNNSIRLMAVQRKINSLAGNDVRKIAGKGIDAAKLQKTIPGESAVLSYHLTNNSLLCFVITKDKFDFFTRPLSPAFYAELKDVYKKVQYRTGNTSRAIRLPLQDLYRQLIKPADNFISGKTDLMIIADGELNYLPFELLLNNEGKSLLYNYTITYNYSCTILQNSTETDNNYTTKLGMAPFSNTPQSSTWARLPFSKNEVEALGGTTVYDIKATKQLFLSAASHYNLIHLATHAYANDKNPDQSFIAFYPGLRDSDISYKIYLPEIYNLKLDKTRLVILSACESGAGELVNGEGVMSLSRAFSYAGCNNIITSMWKADDASTAYISIKLHHYLQGGYSITKALQQARIDYLDDAAIAGIKKQPGYWAHLRVIGGFQKTKSNNYLLFFVISLTALAVILIIKNRGLLKNPRSKKSN